MMRNGLVWRTFLPTLAVALAAVVLLSGNPPPSHLDQVRERGKLVMLTRNGASSYFLDSQGETGPEYELVRAFADFLGVEVEVKIANTFSQLAGMLRAGEGDLIAANLIRTPARERFYRFGPDYVETETRIVVRRGLRVPTGPRDLVGLRLAVPKDSSYEDQLRVAQESVPELEWTAVEDAGLEDLLLAVDQGELDATLIDSRILSVNRHFYPRVKAAFAFGEKLPHAWAFNRGNDDSLVQQAEIFVNVARDEGMLAAIQAQFFDENQRLNQVDMLRFTERAQERLPRYLSVFQEAGAAYDLDWRLLAAMGYQESHWDANAVSPTGVKGLMMLTRGTARQMGLDDRFNPHASIDAGARYFKRLLGKLPDRIGEPDRVWLALAAYNIGFGHLEDARILTERQGGNPDRWDHVKLRLPQLALEKYYRQTRFGYARGNEARQYVENIRRFHETLIWMDTRAHPLLAARVMAAP